MPMSAILANVRAVAFEPVERFEAARGRRMLAGAEGEAGVDLEVDRARRRARWVGVWTKKRPARIGCSPAWLIVTQSASPSCSTSGAPLPSAASTVEFLAARRVVEISVDQPLVGPRWIRLVGDQHRRVVAIGKRLGVGHRLALRAVQAA